MSTSRWFASMFAHVDDSAPSPILRGIIFDMDGTLCQPQTYMFAEMRAALGIGPSVDILHHIDSLPYDRQPAAAAAIRAIEGRAMLSQKPQPGLGRLMSYLDARGIPKAICTRNYDLPVQNLLSKFLVGSIFSPVVTRDFRPPKPHPAGLLHIAACWGLYGDDGQPDASNLIMVGDSLDDMTAGRMAGATTVLLVNDVNYGLARHPHTDLTIKRLDELVAILEWGFEFAR
ncbi:HAD-like domain protein [Ophiocordyceps camponoti-floridani]|uniref:HAD-like domain protein n=1 Tax=Ophiocordyceps camponoti-floridani TaxID=2030778 RepID=A0A8H4QD91_9HYPO|nr:HAD-like domain protein [Ophiocordyceps camponoti-floridani]